MSHGRHHCNNTQSERLEIFFFFFLAVLGIVVLEQRRQRSIDPRTGIGKNYNPLKRTRHFNFPRMRNRPVKNRSASVKKKKKKKSAKDCLALSP